MIDTEKRPEQPQKWLDQRREGEYQACLDEARRYLESGRSAGDYLRGLFEFGLTQSPSLKKRFDQHISPDDYKAIQLREVHSAGAAQIAGQTISRPVFIVTDRSVYERMEKVFGMTEGTSDGLTFPDQFFADLPHWRDVHFILSGPSDRTIGHEVRHSVDPHTAGYDRRNGYDRALGEFFAYYNECIIQEGNRWDLLKRYVGGDGYFSSYTKQAEKPITFEQYGERIDKCIAKLQLIQRLAGDLEAQRRLAQQPTIDGFLSC